MKRLKATFACCLALATIGCVAQQPPDPAAVLSPLRVVLIAGDRSTPAFDNATQAFAANLARRGVPAAAISRLSADPAEIGTNGVRTASLDNIKSRISAMNPAPGQGCLVFATSHGSKDRGLFLSPFREILTPAALATALRTGCGDAPTAVIISACYSGNFTQPPMAQPTRAILTAARPDRPSFGCGAGLRYTFYDECLLKALGHDSLLQVIAATAAACVTAREQGSRYSPSEPQTAFGRQVVTLALPGI